MESKLGDYFVTHSEGTLQGRQAFYWCVMHIRTKNSILYSPYYWDELEAIRLGANFAVEFQISFISPTLDKIIEEREKPKFTLIPGGQ